MAEVRSRLARAWCALFGHAWPRWSPWATDGFAGLRHERTCRRCPAMEVQYDGEEPMIHV